jgi:phenylacetate-CoA ligase
MSESYYGSLELALEAAQRALQVPAYRDEWGQARLESYEDFARLPLLSKQKLIDGAAKRPPFGERLGVPVSELAYAFVGPGPLYLPFTEADMDAARTATAEALRSCGIGPEDVVDQVVAYHWVVGGTLVDGALRKLGCAVVPAGPGNTELHLQSIRALGVTAIVCFPSFLSHLLSRAREQGLELPLRRAAFSGEVRESDFRERILAEHGIVARERYGVGEIGSVASECGEGAGLHLRDDLLIEVIDPLTCDPASMEDPEPKELVVTDRREAMPIVRYRTGDLVEALDLDACACGRTSPRIRRIIGRTGGIPRVKGMFLVPRHVGDVLERRGLPGVRYQLRIDRPADMDRLTVVLAPGDRDLGAIDALADDLATALRMRAEIEQVDALPDDVPLVDDRRALS